jgi:hypothetical protein
MREQFKQNSVFFYQYQFMIWAESRQQNAYRKLRSSYKNVMKKLGTKNLVDFGTKLAQLIFNANHCNCCFIATWLIFYTI